MTQPTNTIPKTPMRFFFFYTWQKKYLFLGALLTVLAATLSSLGSDYSLKLIVDTMNTTTPAQTKIFSFIGLFTIATFCRLIFFRLSGIAGVYWIQKVRRVFQDDIYRYTLSHSKRFFSQNYSGGVTQHIFTIGMAFISLASQFLWFGPSTILTLIISIYLGWTVHWMLGVIFFGWLLITLGISLRFLPKIKSQSRIIAKYKSDLGGVTTDAYQNFGFMGYAQKKYEAQLRDDLLWQQGKLVIQKSVTSETMKFYVWGVGIGLQVAVLSACAYFWTNGIATPGDLVLMVILSGNNFRNMKNITQGMDEITNQYGSMQEALETLLVPHDVVDVEGAKELQVNQGEITLKSVGFSYDEEKSVGENTNTVKSKRVFENLSLTVPAKQRVGLVGKSGVGKSTFVHLLMRSYDIQSGAIMIDGQNIAEVTQDSLRSEIGYVPQDTMLFHRSIAENIGYGSEELLVGVGENTDIETGSLPTDAGVIDAAKKANAHEFISQLPDGYDSLVGERGVKLSGGQRQRIAIARAILQNHPILVLDEATSALDSESEIAIQDSLTEVMRDKTVIAIAHRLSTLRQMDRILVFDDGKIVEDGTHEELLSQGGIYADLWEKQAGGFIAEG